MYKGKIHERLRKTLTRLFKEDRGIYEAVMKKIEEICESADPHHYKSLKYNMKGLKRVHIGHFVLIFYIVEGEREIEFLYFGHHEGVYRRRE
jgi:YafQ family addiction module toxin component